MRGVGCWMLEKLSDEKGKAARTAAVQSGLCPQKEKSGPTLVGPYKRQKQILRHGLIPQARLSVYLGGPSGAGCAAEIQSGALRLHIGEAEDEALAESSGRASDGVQRHRDIARIQEAIELRPAGMELLGHRPLRLLLFAHGLFQLPSQDALDGDGLDFLLDALLLKKTVECGATMTDFFACLPCAHCNPL